MSIEDDDYITPKYVPPANLPKHESNLTPEQKKIGKILGYSFVALLIPAMIYVAMQENQTKVQVIEPSYSVVQPSIDRYKNDDELKYKIRYQLQLILKESMHNPDSYDFVGLEIINYTSGRITAVMKYRGTNAFGGVVTNYITGVVDESGQLLSIADN